MGAPTFRLHFPGMTSSIAWMGPVLPALLVDELGEID
jgi:hypothetical protein